MLDISYWAEFLREGDFQSFFVRASGSLLPRILGRVLVTLAVEKFKDISPRATRIEDALDLAYTFRHHGISIYPIQLRVEIADLLKTLKDKRVIGMIS